MAKPSLAHSGDEPTTPTHQQGRQLFAERYNEIEWLRGDEWLVPTSNLLSKRYVVRLDESPSCEYADFNYRHRECKHIHAAQIAGSGVGR